MRPRRSVALLAAAAVAAVGGAAAQDTAIGSRLKPREDVSVRTPGRSQLAAHRYMHCVVNKRLGSAERAIDALTEDEFQAADRVLSREVTCSSLINSTIQQVGQSIAMSRDVYRGTMAEALLIARGSRPVPAPLPLQREYHSPWTAISGRDPVVEEMAVCVAATAPDHVAALIATEPGSNAELAALRPLSPDFATCLAATAKLTAGRSSMRAALAEAYYHRVFPTAGPEAH